MTWKISYPDRSERRWHVNIGDGRVQSAIADGTEDAFFRALRPGRLVPVSMVAGIVAVIAVASAGVTNAHADQGTSAPANEPQPASPPHAERDVFYPERHVGPIDPAVLERIRQGETMNAAGMMNAGGTMRRRTMTKSPLQLTR